MSFELVEEKLEEAGFFLKKMQAAKLNFYEARFYFSAFLSAARSVTFTLQSVMNRVEGFDIWYQKKERILKSNPIARMMKDLRNDSQKKGNTKLNGGRSYRNASGKSVVEYFIESDALIHEDAVTLAKRHIKLLRSIVRDCRKKFSYDVDPEKFYTIENIKKRNITIEEVEASMGFPRGWTAEIPEKERLRLLKNSTSPSAAIQALKKLESYRKRPHHVKEVL